MENNYDEARRRREEVDSRTLVLRRDGNEEDLEEARYNEKDELLKAFLDSESSSSSEEKVSPPHIEIMRQHELVDYEPAADIGHFRFYPKGALMKDLLEDLAERIAIRDINATKIHTPLLYRTEQEDIAEQAASFHEHDYKVPLKDRELLLRFAGDFGLFSMMKNAHVSHKQVPLRVFEISDSFRLENSGSCSGLKRLRAFTMPDIHCFTADLRQGLQEYAKLYDYYDKLLNQAEIPFAVGFRTTQDFWNKDRQFIVDRLKGSDKDGLVEILDEMKHYWNLKHEFQYVDSTRDTFQLSTVQLDISDSERYGLGYIGEDGKKKPFIIVHSSMGSIERIMGAILEERAKEGKRGEKSSFPYWLSPTQLRLIPVQEEYKGHCENIADYLDNVRVDIDDRPESVGKRVRSANKEWVPFYAVVGKREQDSKRYDLVSRGEKLKGLDVSGKDIDYVKHMLSDLQGESPFRSSYLDRDVSKQLRFGSHY